MYHPRYGKLGAGTVQIRLNRDSMKIAGAAITPVLLTLLLAKAGAPVDDSPSGEADEASGNNSASQPVIGNAGMEPVQFGDPAIPPQADADEAAAKAPIHETARPQSTGRHVPRVAPATIRVELPPPHVETAPTPRLPAMAAATVRVKLPTPVVESATTQQSPSVAAATIRVELPSPVIESASAPQASPERAVAGAQAVSPGVPAPTAVASPEPAPFAPAVSEEVLLAAAPPISPPVASEMPEPQVGEDQARVAAALATAQADTAKAQAEASAPAPGPQVLPETRLALADWNYSLPPKPFSVSSFAANASLRGLESMQPPPEVRTLPAGQAAKARLAQPAARKPTVSGARRSSGGIAAANRASGKYRMVGSAIEFKLPVQVDGEAIGQLTMHVVPNQPVALHLKELVSLFAMQIDPQVLQALNASSNVDQYITFERLREAGIDIRYDAARDQIRLAVDES